SPRRLAGAGRSIIVAAPGWRRGLPLQTPRLEVFGPPRHQTFARTGQIVLACLGLFVSERFRREQPERCQEMVDRMSGLSSQQLWTGLQQFAGMFGYEWGRHRILERLGRKARLLMGGHQDLLAPVETRPAPPLLSERPTT